MVSARGNLVLVFNGEIYNFVELRDELTARGCTFRSDSDSEVLLAAYETWGEDCLLRMNGMWAFAIWNTETHTLFLSRDRFGQKPLFYTELGDRFVFASEMKAICPFLPEVAPSPWFDWMLQNIHEYESTDMCTVKGIKRFPAGCCAVYRNHSLSIRRYWETLEHLEPVPARYEDQVARFRELFIDACRVRMRSDVPIGTALSGGLDSSAVICTIAHVAGRPAGDRVSEDWQHAFTAAFPGTSFDETRYARQVVRHLQVEATIADIDARAGVARFDEYLYKAEDPFITSPIPMMRTYENMRRHGVVVSIDGHGADELLAGYAESLFTAYPDCAGIRDVNSVISAFRGLFGESQAHAVPSRARCLLDYLRGTVLRPRVMRVKRSLLNGMDAVMGMKLRKSLVSAGKWAPGSASPDDAIPAPPRFEDRRQHDAFEHLDHFGRHLYILFHGTTLPTLLRNYDRYAMASGVEIRMPFLDHRLVTYSFSLPWDAKIRRGFTKCILRDAVRDLMPQEVVERKTKIGFGSPPIEWMQRDLREFILDTLSTRTFTECPVISDPPGLRGRIERIMRNPAAEYRDAEAAWTEFMVCLWYRAFIVRCARIRRI